MLIGLTDLEGGTQPCVYFDLGAVVQHKLYGYRGVIVALDMQCMAGEKWYFSNKTQPLREQPWFHVLVHESGGLSTYVAQSNLEPDATGAPVDHPRIHCYFTAFKDGAYVVKDANSGGCSI